MGRRLIPPVNKMAGGIFVPLRYRNRKERVTGGGPDQEEDLEWIIRPSRMVWHGLRMKELQIVKFMIRTLEGVHEASVGEYIIRGIAGEVNPYKPDIFQVFQIPRRADSRME